MLLVNRLKLSATFTAPGCARVFVHHALTSWLLPQLIAPGELIVSELVTNAVKATGSSDPRRTYATLPDLALVAVQVRVWGDSCFIEVWDNDLNEPDFQVTADSADEFGRGLALVAAYSKGVGSSRARRGGKVVWAELDAGRDIAQVPQMRPDPLPRGFRRVMLSHTRQPPAHAAADSALMERIGDRPSDEWV